MANINGYFYLSIHDDKTFLRLVPPADGGEPILITDIRDYLAMQKIEADLATINSLLQNMSGEMEIPIGPKLGFPVHECFNVIITPDRMQAICRFYPAGAGSNGKPLNIEDIKSHLEFKGVKFGVKEDEIKKFLGNKQYCTDVILAEGVLPTRGKDAHIEYFFNTDPNCKPKLNPDGTVDFFNLDNISKCHAGMVLATLTPEVRGKEGYRVSGDRILPPEVKVLRLKYAGNISLNVEGDSIVSDVDGHVSLVDDKVFVSNVYEVVDVDTSTGNIDFPGDVIVTGNIKTGFCVEADGNVEVKGVVEGALVKAGGNVIIARGVNGMSKGMIHAGGNVIAKFVENANINAGGYVHAEAIIHSKVVASGDVTVTGKKGFIVGGSVKSLGNVEAKTIGSEMGGDTEIEVGVDPKIKQRAVQLEDSMKTTKANIEKIEPILTTFAQKIKEKAPLTADQIKYFKQLSAQYQALKQNYQSEYADYQEVSKGLENVSSDSSVIVREFLYPGTRLTINEVSQLMTKTCQHSRFVRDGADIRIKGI